MSTSQESSGVERVSSTSASNTTTNVNGSSDATDFANALKAPFRLYRNVLAENEELRRQIQVLSIGANGDHKHVPERPVIAMRERVAARYSVALIDGNDLLFQESMLRANNNGGGQAARLLRTAVLNQLGLEPTTKRQVVIKIYADVKALSAIAVEAKVVRENYNVGRALSPFVASFSRGLPMVDFIDAGDEHAAKIKISRTFHAYLEDSGCEKILFGVGVKPSYASLLKQVDSAAMSKVTLIDSGRRHSDYDGLRMDNANFSEVFCSSGPMFRIANQQTKVKFAALPGGPEPLAPAGKAAPLHLRARNRIIWGTSSVPSASGNGRCWDFNNGGCTRKNCKFDHIRPDGTILGLNKWGIAGVNVGYHGRQNDTEKAVEPKRGRISPESEDGSITSREESPLKTDDEAAPWGRLTPIAGEKRTSRRETVSPTAGAEKMVKMGEPIINSPRISHGSNGTNNNSGGVAIVEDLIDLFGEDDGLG